MPARQTSTSCWRYSTSDRVDDDTFIGSHPSKNPIRTFGGQMMAQAFVAASRTLSHDLPPSAMSVHFIAGGDPTQDLEFHVVRLRDERRFANRRVDVMQNGAAADHGAGVVSGRRPGARARCRAARACPTR